MTILLTAIVLAAILLAIVIVAVVLAVGPLVCLAPARNPQPSATYQRVPYPPPLLTCWETRSSFLPSQDSGACCSDLGPKKPKRFSLASQVKEQEAASTDIQLHAWR